MRSGSRPAFRARRTRERAVAACTGRVPPTPTIHHQLRRCLAEQNSSWSRAHGAARISRISAVIILRSYSWSNPAGRTNAEYIGNMLDQGHLSVIEHANATFSISGTSHSCSRELVRHRHLSFSQTSQRFVPEANANFIEPEPIAADPEVHALF